jgi:diguanylate cyclase (GGDEF)-like protein/PAS domain S-box-containing protein
VSAHAPVRVFVCEDDAQQRFLISHRMRDAPWLRMAGAAADAKSALTGVVAVQPDVIVLDHFMPGFEYARSVDELREQAPEAKIVVYSGLSPERMRRLKGADAYIEKTSDMAALWETIEELMQPERDEDSPAAAIRGTQRSEEAFVTIDANGLIVGWNAESEATFGWPAHYALGRDVSDLIVPYAYRKAHKRGLARFMRGESGPLLSKRIELPALHRDGHKFPLELTISPLRVGGCQLFNAVLRDASKRRDAERDEAAHNSELEALARTDPLTGLPNRRAWDQELFREMARARRQSWPMCAAILDLDHFKLYNDSHGHQAGDRLLSETAQAWSRSSRISDFLARYGGEEFGLVLPNCAMDEAVLAVERLRGSTPGGETCSAGVASWDGAEPGEHLVARADAALYAAKRAGRDRTIVAADPG